MCERVFSVLLCSCCPLLSGMTSAQLCPHSITYLVKYCPNFQAVLLWRSWKLNLLLHLSFLESIPKCFGDHFRPLFSSSAFLNIKVMNGEENHANLSSLTVIYKMSGVHSSVRHVCTSSHFFYTLTNKGILSGFSRKICPMKLLN